MSWHVRRDPATMTNSTGLTTRPPAPHRAGATSDPCWLRRRWQTARQATWIAAIRAGCLHRRDGELPVRPDRQPQVAAPRAPGWAWPPPPDTRAGHPPAAAAGTTPSTYMSRRDPETVQYKQRQSVSIYFTCVQGCSRPKRGADKLKVSRTSGLLPTLTGRQPHRLGKLWPAIKRKCGEECGEAGACTRDVRSDDVAGARRIAGPSANLDSSVGK